MDVTRCEEGGRGRIQARETHAWKKLLEWACETVEWSDEQSLVAAKGG